MPEYSGIHSPVYEEVINRITKLTMGHTVVDFPEFTLMQARSIQVYSQRLKRVVFLYDKPEDKVRSFPDNLKIQVENDAETSRLLGHMRSIMVLDDLADAAG